MESSLVIEQKITYVDTRYFVGLTPVGNSQFNLGKSQDEERHMMNPNNIAQIRHSSFIMDERTA